jgi:homoserine dehydrogenase
VEEFIGLAQADVLIEITSLNPANGEPAIAHIRSAFTAGMHVITANKGPIAFAYHELCLEAKRRQVEFRYESTVMDGAPVFNTVRNNLPGVTVLGFTGALNSTSKIAVEALRSGKTLADGVRQAQAMGIAEADVSYDLDGWDSAAKTAALANVLMDARTTPRQVRRSGITGLTCGTLAALAAEGKTVVLTSRARRLEDGSLELCVQPEILPETDVLASAKGTSNLLLLHTDQMGTLGTISIQPRVEQTAYGLFIDLVDIARSL